MIPARAEHLADAKRLVLLHRMIDAERDSDGELTDAARADLADLADQLDDPAFLERALSNDGMTEAEKKDKKKDKRGRESRRTGRGQGRLGKPGIRPAGRTRDTRRGGPRPDGLTESEVKDKLGRTQCYDDATGRHVPCHPNTGPNDDPDDVTTAGAGHMPHVAAARKRAADARAAAAGRRATRKRIVANVMSAGKAAVGAAKALGKATWDALPKPVQRFAAGMYGVARWVEHALMKGFEIGRRIARQVGRERGWSKATIDRVGWAVTAADWVGGATAGAAAGYATAGALGLKGLSKLAVAKGSSFLPVGSAAFLVGAFLTGPLSTLRAAWKVLRGQDADAHGHDGPKKEARRKGRRRLMEGSPPGKRELVEVLADRLDGRDEAGRGWYLALFSAALDRTHDPDAAVDLADEALARHAAPSLQAE